MVGDITMQSHTVLDLSAAYLKVDPAHPGGNLIDGSGGIQNSMILGGYIDGNAANVSSSVQMIKTDSPSSSTAFEAGDHNITAHTRIESMTGSNAVVINARRDVLIDVRVENSATHGIRLAGTDIAALFCLSRGAGFDGWHIARPHCHLYKCIGAKCGRYGAWLRSGSSTGDHTYIAGGYYENNDKGINVDSVSKCLISPYEVIGNGQATDGNQAAILVQNANRNWFADMDIHDPKDTTTQQEAILMDSNSTENIIRDIQHDENPQGIVDNRARNIRDGRSYQSAAPGSGTTGDDWDGNEALAAKWNVTVVDDSSTQPYAMYLADGAGQWSQIA